MTIPKHYLIGKDIKLIILAVLSYLFFGLLVLQILSSPINILVLATLFLAEVMFLGLYMFRKLEAENIYDKNRASNYRQMEALFNLFSIYRFDYPLPEMRHWAISPDALVCLLREALKRKVRRVVECGSGVSTIVLAKYLKEEGGGHVYSLDHDPFYANQTRELLKLQGLSEYATVITAPLADCRLDDKSYKWYSVSALQELPDDIDLIFVDGPPAPAGTFNRYPALEHLKDKMSNDCKIVMDDLIRKDEQAIAKEWSKKLKRKAPDYYDVEKKMAVI
jgi:predicted O-methyltransferase YrrM